MSVASNPTTPPDALSYLAENSSIYVRKLVLQNPNTSLDT